MNIKFSPPDISQMEIDEVIDTLKSGWITTGPKTKEFERLISKYVYTNAAVCLNSATAAMEMSLRYLGIGPGDEVITTPYTYSASASVITHVGAKVVMVDITEDGFEMDYDKVAAAITPKTKAIIPVDIGGAVSYTHLDVYKRQGVRALRVLIISFIIPTGNAPEPTAGSHMRIVTNLSSMSLAYLRDVYKRQVKFIAG